MARAMARRRAANFPHANLPSRLSRMVGREEDVLRLSAQLTASRIVSIVGAGGIGKTTVAIAVGHHLSAAFDGAALFVDFGMLSDPNLVAPGVASMLGLAVGSDDVRPSLMAYLRDKRILLILDTCEHLIDAVATLAAGIIEAAPQVHILTTSREALRIEGNASTSWMPLACPPDDPEITAAAVLSFPATQLFIERAAASGVSLDIGDADARIVASICRKLDGVALALELAARRVETCGLPQTAALLDQHLTLGWLGSRTAPPRQKTLQATLDWSFGLLTEPERMVLRRLAVFVGHFTLDAALEVVTSDDPRSIDGLRRDRQPCRQVHGGHPAHRGDDALPAAGHDTRLCTRNSDRRHRTHRIGRAPRGLLPAMAGAVRSRLADLIDRDRTRASLCRSQQRPRGAGMVLWCQRQY